MGDVVLVRHGETQWSAAGRHTSTTDLELTPTARTRPARSAPVGRAGVRGRAVQPAPPGPATAELAGLAVTAVDEDLAEWDYGAYEGLTTAQILTERPDWSLWTDGGPGGESPEQIGARVDRLLSRVAPLLDGGDVALVGHGHCLRVVAARWVGLPAGGGAVLRLDTATLSELGFEHGRPVVLRWNA